MSEELHTESDDDSLPEETKKVIEDAGGFTASDETDKKVDEAMELADNWNPDEKSSDDIEMKAEVDIDINTEEAVAELEDKIEERRQALMSGLITPDEEVKEPEAPAPKPKEKNNRDRVRKIQAARTPKPRRDGMTVAGATPKGSAVSYASSTREPSKRRGEFKIRPDEPINNVGQSTIHKGDGK